VSLVVKKTDFLAVFLTVFLTTKFTKIAAGLADRNTCPANQYFTKDTK